MSPFSIDVPSRPFTLPEVGIGDIGFHVRVAQALLNVHGHTGRETGRFTAGTRRLVLRFQNSSSLPPTGQVDAATWTALLSPPA